VTSNSVDDEEESIRMKSTIYFLTFRIIGVGDWIRGDYWSKFIIRIWSKETSRKNSWV